MTAKVRECGRPTGVRAGLAGLRPAWVAGALLSLGIVCAPLTARAQTAAAAPSTEPASAGSDGQINSYAAEAAKAAREAAQEARAAAVEAKASAAAPADKPAAAVTGSPAAGTPPAAKANAPAPAPGLTAAAKAPPVGLTPARKLFGAATSASPLSARAIGSYAKGCLAGAKALEVDAPAWQAMRLSRNRNWGHPKLIALLERFATEMKTKENWSGLLIGDLAQPRGGPMLTGHKSHQLGLDADVWFKPKPAEVLTRAQRETYEPLLLAEDRGTTVIAANWNEGFVRLVKRAASYPEVERIFVHPAIKKEFCKSAGTDRSWLLKVRPMWLHNYHFHIRMACPEGSPGCEHQAPPSKTDDGCGKEVEDWIKLVSTPPKPTPSPAPAPVPSPPKHEMSLEQLPAECQTVLTAGEPKDSIAQKGVAELAAVRAAAKTAKAQNKSSSKSKIKAAAAKEQ